MTDSRVWSRQEAIENLEDYSVLKKHGGLRVLNKMPLKELEKILRDEGYAAFDLVEQHPNCQFCQDQYPDECRYCS